MKYISSYFFLIISAQSLLLAIALFFRKKNPLANKIDACIFLLFSYQLVMACYLPEGHESRSSVFSNISYSLNLLFGPLFYLNISVLLKRIQYFKARYLLHGIPFIIYNLYLLPMYLMEYNMRVNALNALEVNLFNDPITFLNFSFIGLFPSVLMLMYIIYVLHFSRLYAKNTYNYFSHIETRYLTWLKTGICFLCIGACAITLAQGLLSASMEFRYVLIQISYASIAVFVCMWIYGSLKDPEIFKLTHLMEIELDKEEHGDLGNDDLGKEISSGQGKKYEKTKLDDAVMDAYLEKIIFNMENKKLFTDPDINLKQLSDEINIPMHHISQVINSRLHKNFFNFVNSYRIEEAKIALMDPTNKDYNILDISLDVGFNSKGTFNAMFKKFTNMTPTEFRRKYCSEN